MDNLPPDPTTTLGRTQPAARLGFAVMVERDGNISEEILIGLKQAGYDGIEPNCYHVQHLYNIVEACQHVGISIVAIPTGRWMDVAAAPADYGRYTKQACEYLSEGAAIAASLGVPLILGLIRGPASIGDADAAAFLSSVILGLRQSTPLVQILVEPIAAAEACWPHSIAQGVHLLKQLNQPHVKLLADSYHIVQSGEDAHIERYAPFIRHLHIRDQQKQIPTRSEPEYSSILHLWREHNLVLSFEADVDLSRTLESARAGVQWLNEDIPTHLPRPGMF